MYKSLNYLYIILFAYTFGIQNVSIENVQPNIIFNVNIYIALFI
jgi:hypothetical protein